MGVSTDPRKTGIGLTSESAAKLGLAQNKAVLLGDSFWEYNGGPRPAPTGLVTWDSKGIFVWCNYFLKQAFNVVYNAGVGGQPVSSYLARVPADVDAYAPGWVIGTGMVNDVAQGQTSAQIIASFTALFDYLIYRKNYKVSWNTGTVVTSWTAAQVRVNSDVNAWLKKAPYLWPNLFIVDAYRAVYDPATATIPVTYRIDDTHMNPAGAMRIGRAMADVLGEHVAASPMLEIGNGSSTRNLLTNGRFNNPSAGLAALWSTSGSPVNTTLSQEARTDEAGWWQRMTITSGGNCSINVANIDLAATDKITPGTDSIYFGVEVNADGLDVAEAADSQRFNARVQIYDASSVLLADSSGAYSDGNYDNILMDPGRGVLLTVNLPVPANANKATVTLTAVGAGVFDFDKATLARAIT